MISGAILEQSRSGLQCGIGQYKLSINGWESSKRARTMRMFLLWGGESLFVWKKEVPETMFRVENTRFMSFWVLWDR